MEETPAPDPGFETYIAPPPPRPPAEDPGTDALQGVTPAPEPPAPEPVAPPPPPPAPEPVAEAPPAPAPPPPAPEPVAPAPEPEPAAAAYEYDPNATVMPESLRQKPEPKQEKAKKERKPKAAKPEAAPKPARDGEKKSSKAFPIAIAAGAVIALILGFVVGSGGGGSSEPAADTGALTGTAEASAASVKVPSGWSDLGSAPDVPGLSLKDAKAAAPNGKDGGLAVLVGTADKSANNSTLLAQPFLQAVGDVPKPSGAVQIGGGDVQALKYDALKLNGFDRAVTVYAAPTSAGVATVACLAPPADADSFAATCDQIANTLALSDGDPLPVGPSKDYAAAVSKVMGSLAKADKAGQAKLKAAKTPAAQAAAAGALATAFHKAGKTLAAQDVGPADTGVNALLVKALRQTGGAYDDAASAAKKKSKSAFSKAGGDVADGRKAVANALAGLKAAGYDVAS
jgi:hypothetical protein